MTTAQKVGQLMIWSFAGTEASPELERLLSRYQPGALILFRRNIRDTRQLARLNGRIHEISRRKSFAPIFIMVDQEGGVVTRVQIRTPIPSALALGKMDDPAFVQSFAKTQGELLESLGFNVNLAPVVDISSSTSDTFIGNRTFGDDPDKVSSLGVAYSKGLWDAGMIPTAKHFPGHGGTKQDSHHMVAKKNSTMEQLEERDLIPFQDFVDSNFPRTIMVAHLSLPNVDPSGLPATYSPKLLQERLRGKMGYTGVIITDDLEMSGAKVTRDPGERAIRAFLAGNDMLMFAGAPSHQRQAFQAMVKAVEDERISEARLNESVLRILELKKNLKPEATRSNEAKAFAAIQKLRELSRSVMKKNFEFAVEEQTKPWPEVNKSTRTVVFSSSLGFGYRFANHFKGRTKFIKLSPDTLSTVSEELAKEGVKFGVFYASGIKTAHWLSNLAPQLKAKLIVINCNHTGAVEDQDAFMQVLNLNSHSYEAGEWLAKTLSEPPPPKVEPPPPDEPTEEIRTPAGDGPSVDEASPSALESEPKRAVDQVSPADSDSDATLILPSEERSDDKAADP